MSNQDEHGGDLPREVNAHTTKYPGQSCSHCPAAFFKSEGLDKHLTQKHPDKPRAEAWQSSPGHQVTYYPNLTRAHPNLYVLSDMKTGKHISNLVTGHTGKLEAIETDPAHRRKGHASELWNAAHEHAETTPGVPTPEHSGLRTGLGEKWAKATTKKRGEEMPKRNGTLLSARQMQGMIDFKNQ